MQIFFHAKNFTIKTKEIVIFFHQTLSKSACRTVKLITKHYGKCSRLLDASLPM